MSEQAAGYLRPHPWDAFGPPPKPGPIDEPGETPSPLLNKLLDEWIEAAREYDLAAEDKEEAENRMAAAEERGEELYEEILELRPDWEGPMSDGLDPRTT